MRKAAVQQRVGHRRGEGERIDEHPAGIEGRNEGQVVQDETVLVHVEQIGAQKMDCGAEPDQHEHHPRQIEYRLALRLDRRLRSFRRDVGGRFGHASPGLLLTDRAP
jgi:hypothetical protein